MYFLRPKSLEEVEFRISNLVSQLFGVGTCMLDLEFGIADFKSETLEHQENSKSEIRNSKSYYTLSSKPLALNW